MNHKSIDLISLVSGLLAAASVLGAAALTLGPWTTSDPVPYTLLMISGLAFGMVSRLAVNVGNALAAQAEEIAELRARLGEQASHG